jgi:hypothetical protein
MTNITLTLDEEIIDLGKEYAKKHCISFNTLVNNSLEKTLKNPLTSWLDDMFIEMDKDDISSNGEKWTRGELYRG